MLRMKALLKLTLIITTCAATLWSICASIQGEKYPVMEWVIDGQKRQAIVIPPNGSPKEGVPLVFVFHGGGGSMYRMAELGFQKHWQEAFVVCPQALPTPRRRDPSGESPGWQAGTDTQEGRDLKFFDAILKTLREQYKIDEKRVYATGHSNGGGFTYALWAARSDKLAGIAPSACQGNRIRLRINHLRPLPVMHIAGKQDSVVPFKQQQLMMDTIKQFLQCPSEGKFWARAGTITATVYHSPKGVPFVEAIHPGDHQYPSSAPELIVRFFKELAGGAPKQP